MRSDWMNDLEIERIKVFWWERRYNYTYERNKKNKKCIIKIRENL